MILGQTSSRTSIVGSRQRSVTRLRTTRVPLLPPQQIPRISTIVGLPLLRYIWCISFLHALWKNLADLLPIENLTTIKLGPRESRLDLVWVALKRDAALLTFVPTQRNPVRGNAPLYYRNMWQVQYSLGVDVRYFRATELLRKLTPNALLVLVSVTNPPTWHRPFGPETFSLHLTRTATSSTQRN